MVANIAFNPNLTTSAFGSFNVTSVGYVQGQAQDDPVVRFRLRGAQLATTEMVAMWGGVGVYAHTPGLSGSPPIGYNDVLGPVVGRATTLTAAQSGTLLGFSVFDQDNAMIETPQSPVPTIGSGGRVHYYPLGSLARIAVQCDPVLVDLIGGPLDANVSWDFVNQRLVPYNASALTISSGTYVTGTGVVTLTMSAPIDFGPGDAIVVSSLTGTGTNLALLNGTFTALAGTTGSTVVYNAGAGQGAITITGGSLSLGSGAGSILPVQVLDVQAGNSMTVNYDPTTTFATWNRSGSCAIIQI